MKTCRKSLFSPKRGRVASLFSMAALAGLILVSGSQGQVAIKKPILDSMVKPGPGVMVKPNEYLRKHDLEVSSFAGTFEGKNIVLGGQIKNNGPAAYPGGREILLYVSSGGQGWIPKGSAKIPPLQPGQTWPIPTFTFRTDSVPTTRFKLFIPAPALDRDANYLNDSKITDVTGLR